VFSFLFFFHLLAFALILLQSFACFIVYAPVGLASHETVFGFLRKKGRNTRGLVQLSTFDYLFIPSPYEDLAFLLFNDTLMENTFLLECILVKSQRLHF